MIERAPGPRLAVVGNCQAASLAEALRAMTPGGQVKLFSYASGSPSPSEVLEYAAGCDRLFVHKLNKPAIQALYADARLAPRITTVPVVVFAGYHPDCVYIGARQSQGLKSPIGDYHSSLIAACYLSDLAASRVPDLFNAYVYARAGFFERFEAAKAYMAQVGEPLGFDFDGMIARWETSGAFMHSVNHPKAAVLWDLAESAAGLAGLPVTRPKSASRHDWLERTAWPVYPEIGRRHDTPGSLVFRSRHGVEFDLEAFVQASYRIYEAAGLKSLRMGKQVRDLMDFLAREVRR